MAMKTDTGEEIIFLRADGTRAQNTILQRTISDTGEVMFCELTGYTNENVRGKLKVNGRETFKLLFVQRVFPCIKAKKQLRDKWL